ncbi:alpha/beta fold hydrolase [Streptomyces racemochromogenes]|uniref:Alpha/beta fold hydrolase n=1 Tax=Streptomyces racemochromogenes TaxID=67353 RepID=A0ABW7P5Z2_9ACTN
MHPAAHSLYPELDATALNAFAAALETGEPAGLPPARAAEAAAVRAATVFSRGKVTGADGTLLDAALWRHTGPAPRPVVVMPAPWSDLGWPAYAVQASRFAIRGYDVLAYSPRGFAASGGHADCAGPLDVTDGRHALDHLLERTAGPVTRIGVLGVSYGAGIAQLVAAHDARVDAVAALSGWGDLGEVLRENHTRRTAAVHTLLTASPRARLSRPTERALEDVLAGHALGEALAWAEQRSPFTHVKELGRRRVAVFCAQAWHETLFPAGQVLRMFQELTGPKRIDLSIGDHCGPEMTGLPGLPNRIWADALRWFDHHLAGVDNGIDAEGEVLSEVMWTRALEPSPVWPLPTHRVRRLHLTGTGELADAPDPGWAAVVLCGVETPVAVADAVARSGYAELEGLPKRYPAADAMDRTATAVWTAAPAAETTRLRGTPRLRVTYRAANSGSTVVAYLLDLAPDGSARLITHAPFSDLDAPPDSLISADVDLHPIAYDLPPDHRPMLALTTRDPFYADANLPRATLSFTSPEPTPSYVELPLG